MSEVKLKDLPEDSSDIFEKNMLDRYSSLPVISFSSGRYAIVGQICFAEFLYFCSLKNYIFSDENQPTILIKELLEELTNNIDKGTP